jgi:hypothetical protein
MRQTPFTQEQWADILQRVVGWTDTRVTTIDVLRGQHPPYTCRLSLVGSQAPCPIIAKVAVPYGPRPADVEGLLHAWLLAVGAPLPRLLWHGMIANDMALVLLDDLAITHRLHTHEHLWSPDEIRAVMSATAQFHAAGMRLPLAQLRHRHPWLVPASSIWSSWLPDICARASRPPLRVTDPHSLEALQRLHDWMQRYRTPLTAWETIIHADIFWGNVALYDTVDGVQATLLDLGSASIGLPQYDAVYLRLRGGFPTDAGDDIWPHSDRWYEDVLRPLLPARHTDGPSWDVAQAVAEVQMNLEWHAHIIALLDKGDQATLQDRDLLARQVRGPLFGETFIHLCQRLFTFV